LKFNYHALQEHPSYSGRRVFLGSVRRYEKELKRAELKWWEMEDDLPVGCEYRRRAQLARQVRKEANKQRGDRYYRSHYKEIILRKQWDRERKKMLRHCATSKPGPDQIVGSGWDATQALFHPHPKNSLVIVIDDDDEDEVIFTGTTGKASIDDTPPVVEDDTPCVSYLPLLHPNT
jgi:hypothetical protein